MLTLIPRGHEFWSDRSGRFDLMRSAYRGDWVVIDFEDGEKTRGTREECEEWMRARAGK